MLTPRGKPRLRPDLLFRRVDDDYVVYDPVRDATTLLNMEAAAVLDLCDGEHGPEEIAAELASLMQLPLSEVATQVQRILGDFRLHGFLDSSKMPGAGPAVGS